jgi:hypothetical protein
MHGKQDDKKCVVWICKGNWGEYYTRNGKYDPTNIYPTPPYLSVDSLLHGVYHFTAKRIKSDKFNIKQRINIIAYTNNFAGKYNIYVSFVVGIYVAIDGF